MTLEKRGKQSGLMETEDDRAGWVGRRPGNGGEQSGKSVALAAVVSLIFAHTSHLCPTAMLKVRLSLPLWVEKVML